MNYRSDPTYEAWKPGTASFERASALVPILPTRHGNTSGTIAESRYDLSSDPTYEAWKHNHANANLKRFPAVPILPTRHGNRTLFNVPTETLGFRSYLRGMETRKRSNRNRPPCKFRSYLRGMETYRRVSEEGNSSCSDPTYEAWKLILPNSEGEPW